MTPRKERRNRRLRMSDKSPSLPHYYLACDIAMNIVLLNIVDTLSSDVRSFTSCGRVWPLVTSLTCARDIAVHGSAQDALG